MSLATNQAHLLHHQYQNASNLNARIALHARFSINSYGWHRWMFDQFAFPDQCHVLELGCGPGTLWLKNQERIPADWNIMLSDFSAGMVEEARRNLTSVVHSFTFQQIDAQSIPLPDSSLDAVIANHMLYHVPDRNKAFAEVRRVLKPTGTLYTATNGRDHLREISQMQERFGIPDTIGTHTDEFCLENGAEQLTPWFADISLRRYEDALRVTEVEPLVAFILSMSNAPSDEDTRMEALREFIVEKLAREKAFHITKSTGLFLASKHE